HSSDLSTAIYTLICLYNILYNFKGVECKFMKRRKRMKKRSNRGFEETLTKPDKYDKDSNRSSSPNNKFFDPTRTSSTSITGRVDYSTEAPSMQTLKKVSEQALDWSKSEHSKNQLEVEQYDYQDLQNQLRTSQSNTTDTFTNKEVRATAKGLR